MIILRGGPNSNRLGKHGIIRHKFDKGGYLSGAQDTLFQMRLYCLLHIAAEKSHLVFAKYLIRRAIPPVEFFRSERSNPRTSATHSAQYWQLARCASTAGRTFSPAAKASSSSSRITPGVL